MTLDLHMPDPFADRRPTPPAFYRAVDDAYADVDRRLVEMVRPTLPPTLWWAADKPRLLRTLRRAGLWDPPVVHIVVRLAPEVSTVEWVPR